MHMPYRPGKPITALETWPGTRPAMLSMIRLIARPMVALARQPGPSRPQPSLMSSCLRTGPLTMSIGEVQLVVTFMAPISNFGSASASTAATTTGKYEG